VWVRFKLKPGGLQQSDVVNDVATDVVNDFATDGVTDVDTDVVTDLATDVVTDVATIVATVFFCGVPIYYNKTSQCIFLVLRTVSEESLRRGC